MQDVAGFNRKTGVVFILILLAFLAFQFRDFFSVYQKVINTVKVNDKLTIYVTEVARSSLSKDTYSYYFYDTGKSNDDVLNRLKKIEPFMTTDDDKASAEVRDGQLFLRVRGNIYSFSSVGYNIRIHLDSSPY